MFQGGRVSEKEGGAVSTVTVLKKRKKLFIFLSGVRGDVWKRKEEKGWRGKRGEGKRGMEGPRR